MGEREREVKEGREGARERVDRGRKEGRQGITVEQSIISGKETCSECPLRLDPEVLDVLASCDPLPWSPDLLAWSCDVRTATLGWLDAVFTDVGRDIPTAKQRQHMYIVYTHVDH